jgi:aryl-alcohol dehydrogenase-like predicted oxidoreductase
VNAGISKLGLGGHPLAGGYGALDERQAHATLDAALDAGWTLVDTAEVYGGSEELLGRLLVGRRDRVYLVTKVFPSRPYSRTRLRSALDASLARLRTDAVDLFLLHGPENAVFDFRPTPVEELADSLRELVASGKTRAIGVSNFGRDAAAELADHVQLAATEDAYSIFDREHELELLPWVRQRGIAFLAYTPLARGLLSNRRAPERRFAPDDHRSELPRFEAKPYREYVAVAEELRRFASDRGRTLVELALAWVLRHPAVSAAIVGAKSPEQVAEASQALTWELGEEDAAEVVHIASNVPVPVSA